MGFVEKWPSRIQGFKKKHLLDFFVVVFLVGLFVVCGGLGGVGVIIIGLL